VDASSSIGAVVVAENTCTDLRLGDIEQLLMQISDDQRNAELFSDLSTSVPKLQFQSDGRHVWLDADSDMKFVLRILLPAVELL
jgi:hypothetical protein